MCFHISFNIINHSNNKVISNKEINLYRRNFNYICNYEFLNKPYLLFIKYRQFFLIKI